MNERRVVVTGLGAVTPIGVGVADFWESLQAGRNGIGRVTHFDTTGFRSCLAGEVKDFDPGIWMDRKAARRMDPFTHFGMAASRMAIEDAGLDQYEFAGDRAGVIIGSGIGGSDEIEDGYHKLIERDPGALSPFLVSKLLINMAACMVSIKYGLRGPLSAPSVACSTGSVAVGQGLRIVQRGDADIMVVGAAEACINPLPYGGFCATRSMSPETDPEIASRPFDKNRNGFIMGEGAGIAVLESLEHATARGARIYAEIAGYGNTADAYHFTAPEPNSDGMIRVMQVALGDAGVNPAEVGYINAHGTSTALNDKCESAAIMRVFGDHAKSLKVSSNKSMIGHLMAAAGAVEFVSQVMSVNTGIVPPTINYQEPDPDCPLDYVVAGAEKIDLNVALSNSFGFGGGNACILVKKFGDK